MHTPKHGTADESVLAFLPVLILMFILWFGGTFLLHHMTAPGQPVDGCGQNQHFAECQ